MYHHPSIAIGTFFKGQSRSLLFTLALFIIPVSYARAWQQIAPGLQLQTFTLPRTDQGESPQLSILKIDPARYTFTLITTSRYQQHLATLKEWSEREGLTAAINASMYREDHQQSTGYMKTQGHINNGYINPRFGAFMVFSPKNTSLPQVQILDRSLQDWKHIIPCYDTVIQNFRLINSQQKNLWPKTRKAHSIAAIGIDAQRQVLFIHCQTPLTIHEFNEALLNLPLDIFNAMYVEGGPEAAMYLKTATIERSWPGRYEHPVLGTIHQKLWPIPNVIGIVPKEYTQACPENGNQGEPPCK